MTNNANYIKKSQLLVKEFEEQKDPERLGDACIELQKVNLKREKDIHALAQNRLAALLQWLHLVQLLDDNIDPSFDINQGVSIKTPRGNSPDADGESAADRKKAADANNKKIQNFNLQVSFSRLDNHIPRLSKTFVRQTYTGLPTDQLELKTSIEKTLKNPARKEDFLQLLVPIIKK